MDVDREATLLSLLEDQQELTPAPGGGGWARLLKLESLGSICPADLEGWRATAAAIQRRDSLPPGGGRDGTFWEQGDKGL